MTPARVPRPVRLYMVTGGRARPGGGLDWDRLDVLTEFTARSPARPGGPLPPEQARVLELCAHRPQTLAELSACLDLPRGVMKVLLGSLLDGSLITACEPGHGFRSDPDVLKAVLHGLTNLPV